MKNSKVQFNKVLGKSELEDKSKFVMLCIEYALHIRDYREGRTPTNKTIVSHEYMRNRFGIASRNFTTALNELEKNDFIEKKKINATRGKRYLITVKSNDKYELIENIYLTTPCLTVNEKIFIALLHIVISDKGQKDNYSIDCTQYRLIKELEKLGLKSSSIKDRLDSLTTGNIPLIIKTETGYQINQEMILAMYRLSNNQWGEMEYTAQAKGSEAKYPIYKKANVKLYKWDEDKQRIIKTVTNE